MGRLRNPKLQPALRVCAMLSLLVWISGVSYCSLESLFGPVAAAHHFSHEGHDHEHPGQPADGSGHSHDSDQNGSGADACCKSLTTVAQVPGSTHIAKPQLVHLSSFTFSALAQALTSVQPEVEPARRARTREWVFTPVVYLGPALRSQAPPLAS